MRFALYPPYIVSIFACALSASWLIPSAGVRGPALMLLIASSAGVVLIYWARQEIGARLILTLAAAAVVTGALALA
jgi:hypothetical protein